MYLGYIDREEHKGHWPTFKEKRYNGASSANKKKFFLFDDRRTPTFKGRGFRRSMNLGSLGISQRQESPLDLLISVAHWFLLEFFSINFCLPQLDHPVTESVIDEYWYRCDHAEYEARQRR